MMQKMTVMFLLNDSLHSNREDPAVGLYFGAQRSLKRIMPNNRIEQPSALSPACMSSRDLNDGYPRQAGRQSQLPRQLPEFAVTKRFDMDVRQFLSGGGEDDETPMQAARREASEEGNILHDCKMIKLDSMADNQPVHLTAKSPPYRSGNLAMGYRHVM